MIETIGFALINTGAVIGIWGFFWRLWDNRSMAPGVLCGVGIVALVIGDLMT